MKTVVRLFLAVLAAFVFVVAFAPAAIAQAAPPVANFGASSEAAHYLDSLATEARTKRIENAACLTAYAVVGDTLYLDGLSKANYVKADSANIYGFGDVCPRGVPTLHSHFIAIVDPNPSKIDLRTSKRLGTWAAILVVGDSAWRIIVY